MHDQTEIKATGSRSGAITDRLVECAEHTALIICDMTEPDTIILNVSPGTEQLSGFSRAELIGHSALSFLHQEIRDEYRRIRKKLIEHGKGITTHVQVCKRNGKHFPAQMTLDPLRDQQDHIVGILITLVDISQEAKSTTILQHSQDNFKLLFNKINDFLFVASKTGKLLHWNTAIETRLHYTPEQLSTFHIADLHPTERHDQAVQAFREMVAGSRNSAFLPLQTAEGELIPTEIRTVYGQWNNEDAIFGLSRDISKQLQAEEQLWHYRERLEELVEHRTQQLQKLNENLEKEIIEHKRTEQALKNGREALRALSARLQNVREDERTNIARTIHDELGSALTGLKMDIAWLERKFAAEPPEHIRHRTSEMQTDIDQTIQLVRKLSTELRPGVLDTVGLIGAMEWQTEEFKKRTNARCVLKLQENIQLDPERATAIFRIFQEILTNITRHAEASSVRITAEEHETALVLEVTDNGKGMSKEQITGPEAIGILGMRERAHVFGGDIKISSIPAKGTTISVRIPLSPDISTTGKIS